MLAVSKGGNHRLSADYATPGEAEQQRRALAPASPTHGGIEGVRLLLLELFRRDDRAEAASSPCGGGGAWDLDVPGSDLGAATDDLFAKPMVIGPACPRQGLRRWCHRTSISHRPSKTSMIFSMPLLRPLEFGMSVFTAGRGSTTARKARSVDLGKGWTFGSWWSRWR